MPDDAGRITNAERRARAAAARAAYEIRHAEALASLRASYEAERAAALKARRAIDRANATRRAWAAKRQQGAGQ